MALPAAARAEAIAILERYCNARASDARRLEHRERGNSITLLERRPPWQPDADPAWSTLDVVQFRYDTGTALWSLSWPRASGRWERYDDIEPAPSIATLLAEVDADPDGVFWG